MRSKNILLVFSLLVSFSYGLSVNDVSGKYTAYATLTEPTPTDPEATTVAKSQLSIGVTRRKNVVQVKLDWMESSGANCQVNQSGTIEGNSVVVRKDVHSDSEVRQCELKFTFDNQSSEITLADKNDVCRKEFCTKTAAMDQIKFSSNSRVVAGVSKMKLVPSAGQKLCFSRIYASKYLDAHPGQIPYMMNLELRANAAGDFTNTLSIYTRGEDGVEHSGGGLCTKITAAGADCHLDSDSGEYTVTNKNNGSVLLKPNDAVFLSNIEDEAADRVALTASDAENKAFMLYPAVCPDVLPPTE